MKTLRTRPLAPSLLAVMTLLAGCSRQITNAHGANLAAQKASLASPASRQVHVFKSDGQSASWSEITTAMAGADAVLMGENHSHPLGLATAAALWRDTLAASPQAVLAMEFIERDEQAALDDYVTGITDEAKFMSVTRRNDQSFPPGHRDMIAASKAASRPVIAANAPRRYVSIARTQGFDRLAKLTDEQRRLLCIPATLPTGRYRDDFEKIMGDGSSSSGQHGDDAAAAAHHQQVEAMFRSQSVWDWTMSQSVVRATTLGKPVVLIVGRFHVDFGGGLFQALKLQAPALRPLVVSFIDDDAPAAGIREEDKGRADFIIYTGKDVTEE
jgi:uncharacterized iron-regulated protein